MTVRTVRLPYQPCHRIAQTQPPQTGRRDRDIRDPDAAFPIPIVPWRFGRAVDQEVAAVLDDQDRIGRPNVPLEAKLDRPKSESGDRACRGAHIPSVPPVVDGHRCRRPWSTRCSKAPD